MRGTLRLAALAAALALPASARASVAIAPYGGLTSVADGGTDCMKPKNGSMAGIDLGVASDRLDYMTHLGYAGTSSGGPCAGGITVDEIGALLNISLTDPTKGYDSGLGYLGLGLQASLLNASVHQTGHNYGSGSGFGFAGELWWKVPISRSGRVVHEGHTFPQQIVELMPRVGYRSGTVTATDQGSFTDHSFAVGGPYVAVSLFVAFNLFD